MIEKYKLIKTPPEIAAKLDRYISKYRLESYKKELDYHFNRGDWQVNLADTKRSMINYDFNDLVNGFYAKLPKNDGETNKDHKEREMEATEALRSGLLNLHLEFKNYVIETLKPIVSKIDYDELLALFKKTWGNAPFKIDYLLEDMFLMFGDKSIMQNVVGDSGSFKSTRTMIEANSLPSTLFIDDATVAGISRDSQIKGRDYLDNTVVYYNDVGDSSQMLANFKDCLQTVYKKLHSEGRVNRTLSQKNSDRTLHLDLRTEHGFKLKFNSVKLIFNEDDGQTSSRTMVISLPSITPKEAEEMVRSGRFGEAVWTNIDPRIFKNVLETYYITREKPQFTSEHNAILTERCNQDNNDKANMHKISNILYIHKEMCKLYGPELYKTKYFNRVMINNSVKDLENELYDAIHNGLGVSTKTLAELFPGQNLSDVKMIASTASASAHKDKNHYDAFTIKAVKGIRRKFIRNHVADIPMLLNMMEEHELIRKVGKLSQYNVYVLLEREASQ